MIAVKCLNCGKGFMTYQAWLRKGSGKTCSYKCMGERKLGKPTYERTLEHNQKMSRILKNIDNTNRGIRFTKLNAGKKCKTYEELYPLKAGSLRESLATRLIGEGNPNWKGGKHRQKYPYIFYKLRPVIFERDNYTCLNCGMSDEEARSKDSLGRGLTVHHIDYNKENNNLDNLATTCKWCNSLANGKRELWQIKYAQLLLGL